MAGEEKFVVEQPMWQMTVIDDVLNDHFADFLRLFGTSRRHFEDRVDEIIGLVAQIMKRLPKAVAWRSCGWRVNTQQGFALRDSKVTSVGPIRWFYLSSWQIALPKFSVLRWKCVSQQLLFDTGVG